MRIFGLAGWSGSGKTTLMTLLIPELISRGITVSTLKHAHHSFDVDRPGKDSWRHRQAGAEEVDDGLAGDVQRLAWLGVQRIDREVDQPEPPGPNDDRALPAHRVDHKQVHDLVRAERDEKEEDGQDESSKCHA